MDEKAIRRQELLEKLHKRKKVNKKDEGEDDEYRIVPNPLSTIKNKERRTKLFKKMQQQKKKLQKIERRKRKQVMFMFEGMYIRIKF